MNARRREGVDAESCLRGGVHYRLTRSPFASMISLFRNVPQVPISMSQLSLIRMVIGNVICAGICALLAFVWLGVAFTAGEYALGSGETIVPNLILWASILALVIVGVIQGCILKHLPWLAVVLTPFFLGLINKLPGEPDGFAMGLRFGSYISALYFGGALAGRGLRYWMWKTGRRPSR